MIAVTEQDKRRVSLWVELHKWCAHSCKSKPSFKVSCSFFWCEKSEEVIRLMKKCCANEAPLGQRFPIPKMHMGKDAYGYHTPFVPRARPSSNSPRSCTAAGPARLRPNIYQSNGSHSPLSVTEIYQVERYLYDGWKMSTWRLICTHQKRAFHPSMVTGKIHLHTIYTRIYTTKIYFRLEVGREK